MPHMHAGPTANMLLGIASALTCLSDVTHIHTHFSMVHSHAGREVLGFCCRGGVCVCTYVCLSGGGFCAEAPYYCMGYAQCWLLQAELSAL
jgi:hypothetical protein